MNKIEKALAVALCALALGGCGSVDTPATEQKNTTLKEEFVAVNQDVDSTELAKIVSPAVVGISSSDSDGMSVGSGVCVASSGYVLTNSHVISNPNYIRIHLVNGDSVSAELVFNDSVQDIAVVKANATLPYLKLADTDQTRVGEDVLAVGTPLSLTLKHTFTKGIVSALNRTIKVNTLSGEAYMQNLIQHDASINPGNSGGPLVNSRAEVVGINTLKISGGEGIGFAIPAKSIKSLVNKFISDSDYQVPYLGVYGYDSEIAKYYGHTDKNNGFYVLDVDKTSELSMAGIKEGDVIVTLNHVNINNVLDLKNELYQHARGSVVNVGFVQDGIYKEAEITLDKNNTRQ